MIEHGHYPEITKIIRLMNQKSEEVVDFDQEQNKNGENDQIQSIQDTDLSESNELVDTNHNLDVMETTDQMLSLGRVENKEPSFVRQTFLFSATLMTSEKTKQRLSKKGKIVGPKVKIIIIIIFPTPNCNFLPPFCFSCFDLSSFFSFTAQDNQVIKMMAEIGLRGKPAVLLTFFQY